jgi:long-chain-alcohol oxidase
MRRECHPLLSGGRARESKHNHGLSPAEMDSLASLCETILPSLPPPVTTLDGKQHQPTKAVQALYRASGSQTPMPDEV